MPLQFHQAVGNVDVWSASRADISFVITSPTGPGFHGHPGFFASWRPLYSSGGAAKVIGSPFNTFGDMVPAIHRRIDAEVPHYGQFRQIVRPVRPFKMRTCRFSPAGSSDPVAPRGLDTVPNIQEHFGQGDERLRVFPKKARQRLYALGRGPREASFQLRGGKVCNLESVIGNLVLGRPIY